MKGCACADSGVSELCLVAALTLVGTLGLPAAGAAPVAFSPTPVAGWSTNGTVKAVLVVGDTVYVGRRLHPGARPGRVARPWPAPASPRSTAPPARSAPGSRPTPTATCASSPPTAPACSSAARSRTIKGVSQSRPRRRSTSPPATSTPASSANANSNVYALNVNGSRLYVGGSFSTIGSTSRSRFARGVHHHRRGRPELQPQRERHGARDHVVARRQPGLRRRRLLDDRRRLPPVRRDRLAHDRSAAAAGVPVLDASARSSTSTSPPTGSAVFAALGDHREPGDRLEHHDRQPALVPPSRRRHPGDQVLRRQRLLRLPRRCARRPHRAHARGRRRHRRDRPDLPPADQQLLRRLGHRRQRDRARHRRRVHHRERRQRPGRRHHAVAAAVVPPPPPPPPPPTTTLVAAGSTWRYLDNGTQPGHRLAGRGLQRRGVEAGRGPARLRRR